MKSTASPDWSRRIKILSSISTGKTRNFPIHLTTWKLVLRGLLTLLRTNKGVCGKYRKLNKYQLHKKEKNVHKNKILCISHKVLLYTKK